MTVEERMESKYGDDCYRIYLDMGSSNKRAAQTFGQAGSP